MGGGVGVRVMGVGCVGDPPACVVCVDEPATACVCVCLGRGGGR